MTNNLSLAQAATLLHEFTGAPRAHPATMNRYCGKGIVGPNGDRIVLASIRRGRMRFTSASAVRDFFESTNPPSHADSESELASDGI
jgi:hypothetical protein